MQRGKNMSNSTKQCPGCRGKGDYNPFMIFGRSTCHWCKGTGWIILGPPTIDRRNFDPETMTATLDTRVIDEHMKAIIAKRESNSHKGANENTPSHCANNVV
jgi:hypothetical protein